MDFLLNLLDTALSALQGAGVTGALGAAVSAGAFYMPFRWKLLPIAAIAGGLVLAGAYMTGFIKGNARAAQACRVGALKDENAELRRQHAAAREIAKRQLVRVIEANKEKERVDVQVSELDQMLKGLLDNPVCLRADTSGLLDSIGR